MSSSKLSSPQPSFGNEWAARAGQHQATRGQSIFTRQTPVFNDRGAKARGDMGHTAAARQYESQIEFDEPGGFDMEEGKGNVKPKTQVPNGGAWGTRDLPALPGRQASTFHL